MVTSSMAASPLQSLRVYENLAESPLTDTVAECQVLPWLPLLVHRVVPSGDFMLSVPMAEPYMW